MFIVNDPVLCRIVFPSIGGSGPHVVRSAVIPLPDPARPMNVHAVLVGFSVAYSGRADHHYGQMQIDLVTVPVGAQSVEVTATLGLRDWSVNSDSFAWDDSYEGEIRFAIVGE